MNKAALALKFGIGTRFYIAQRIGLYLTAKIGGTPINGGLTFRL